VLYHFRASPYALKVRLALSKLGVAIEMKDILEDDVAQAELVEYGKRDQVPCLKLPGSGAPDQWLYESSKIVKYLREKAENDS
jgi:glutathione S-transferase